jgi:hypothetical protein
MGGCLSASLYTLSVATHAWLLVEIDAGRTTCEELVYETTAALGANAALLLFGCLHGVYAKRSGMGSCFGSYATLLLATVSALVVILSSRLTLFVHEAHLICAADVAHVTSSTDILVDADKRAMVGGLAWGALLFLGVGVLLQHCKPWWDEDCEDVCDKCRVEDDCGTAKKKIYGVVYANVDRAPRRFAHPGIRA